jgi:hypothetical protein
MDRPYFYPVKREEIIEGFVFLGQLMNELGNMNSVENIQSKIEVNEYNELINNINKQKGLNGWFVKENVCNSLKALGSQLTLENLTNWTNSYTFESNPKKVALIMAGNIPLVGFHDFLCVLLSGNVAVCKLSSDDKTLLPALATQLIKKCPGLTERIIFTLGQIGKVDAVIATGSDNSLKFFEEYFGKYPHVFRKNRSSIAVLTGNETKEELIDLGHDFFDYFGLGCRNVSQVFLPEDFEINRIFEAIVGYADIVNHHKYANNYDYNKAVYLLNKIPLLDNNFVLFRENESLFSPLAMIHYQRYQSISEVTTFIENNKDSIQAIVGHGYIPFGKAQCPMLNDYADGIDTMAFLNSLS